MDRRPRPLERAVRGGQAQLEDRGRVVCGPVEHVAKDQDRALARREMLDRGEKRELDRLSRDDHIRRLGTLVEQAIRVRLKPREVGRRLRARAELGRRARVIGHEPPRPTQDRSSCAAGSRPPLWLQPPPGMAGERASAGVQVQILGACRLGGRADGVDGTVHRGVELERSR